MEDCRRCVGRGYLLGDHEGQKVGILCDKCLGSGELDWIGQVTGGKFSLDTLRKRRKKAQKLRLQGFIIYNSSPGFVQERLDYRFFI